jgi:uncharacterized protein YndB with AHSA1/START domain
MQTITKVVAIQAKPSVVWKALTHPDSMNQWMFDSKLDIITDWRIGGAMIIRGHLNGKPFENRGVVLQFVPGRVLQYSHLSSLLNLPDTPENHTLVGFAVTHQEDRTVVSLTLDNFPTESTYKHLAFYWTVALDLLRRFVEKVTE